MKKHLLLVSFLVLCLFVVFNANAMNVQSFKPSTAYTQGFQLFTSDAQKQFDLSLGFSTNYVHNPLEVGLATGARTQGLVDQLITTDFLVSYGITDWWTFSIDMPVNWYHNVAPVLIPSRDKGGVDLGDLRVWSKFTLFNANDTAKQWGLALIAFASFQTGDEAVYMGDNNITGGAVLAVDKLIEDNRFFINLGARFREAETLRNITMGHEFLFGVGYQRPIVKKWDLDVNLEFIGSTKFEDFFGDSVTTPLDLSLTFTKKMLTKKNLIFHLGGSRGFTGGYGSPDARIYAGLSYTFSIKSDAPRPKPKKSPKLKSGIVFFDFDKSNLKAQYKPEVARIAAYYHKYKHVKFTIHGHTDAKGSNDYNVRLAKRRARTVKNAMVAKGVPTNHIAIYVHGEEKPIATNETDHGRAKNRRVEITLYVTGSFK